MVSQGGGDDDDDLGFRAPLRDPVYGRSVREGNSETMEPGAYDGIRNSVPES